MKFRPLSFVLLIAIFTLGLSLSAGRSPVSAQSDNRGITANPPASSEHRVALVIGNNAYSDSPLLNPVNDARAMSQALRRFGFELVYGENLSLTDMKRNIRTFGEKIRNGGVGLFYYAGHGVQINGRNYLIPVSATITKEEEVEDEAVDVGLVLAQMQNARNRLNLIILDACRNNPFARSFRSINSGLASINAPSGTLIAYATAPGSVASDGAAKNGLYTQELLNTMSVPGLKIEELFKRVRIAVQNKTAGKQIPWEASSLVGEFAFDEQAANEVAEVKSFSFTDSKASNPNPNEETRSSIDPTTIELSFWDSIKGSADPEDYKAYLEKYPAGTFVVLAKNKIRSLEDSAKPSPTNTNSPTGSTANSSSSTNSQPAKTVTLKEIELSYKSNLIDETIQNASTFLETTPNSKEAQAYLGLSLLIKKNVDGAVIHLEKAVLLGEPMTFPVKRLREPLIGHGLDEASVTLTMDSIIIKTGKTFFQANFSSLSDSRIQYYNSQCPIVFLKGVFAESSENSQKSKQGAKQFNLFPPSATLQPMRQDKVVYNLAACNDEGIITTGIVKLLYRLMTNRR